MIHHRINIAAAHQKRITGPTKSHHTLAARHIRLGNNPYTKAFLLQQGEHGIGFMKAAYVLQELGRDGYLAQKSVKDALDPQGFLNPGKIFIENSLTDPLHFLFVALICHNIGM